MKDLKEIRWDFKSGCFIDDERNKVMPTPIENPKVWRENIERSFLETCAREIGANAYCTGTCLETDRAWDHPVSISRVAYQFYKI